MKAHTPLVSIILPVYNGEQTLEATLKSLLSQSFSDFELLIGIDGSKDGSKAIAESFRDSRIQIIEHPINLGLGDNLNAIIPYAHPESKYFAMAEQDDVYVYERLAWQVQVMEQNEDVGLVSGIVEYKNNSNSVLFPGILIKGGQFPQGEELFKFLYVNQLKVVNSCMMWRKTVHQKNNLCFRNTYGNFNIDWDYILRFSLVSKIYGIPKKLVIMNRGLTNTSVTRNKALQHQITRQFLKNFREEFPQLINNKTYKKALKEHCKIEIGHRSKLGIICFGLYYSLIYYDWYFIDYIIMRIKKFANKS